MCALLQIKTFTTEYTGFHRDYVTPAVKTFFSCLRPGPFSYAVRGPAGGYRRVNAPKIKDEDLDRGGPPCRSPLREDGCNLNLTAQP
jgi:hypothetical protein